VALPAVVLRAVARGPRRRGAAGLMLLGGMAEQAAAKSTKVNLEEEVLGEKLPLEDWRPFPKNFIWGVATAAFQVEGGVNEGGRGPSIWDTFSHVEGNIFENATAEVACDHFHRYKEDILLVKELGANAYRFSISWSRVLPTGSIEGGISEKGLAFYEALCQEVLANGIEPIATLYHWDLPEALEQQGGWLQRGTVDAFAAYASLCFQRLGKYVKTWCSINEPWTQCFLGYSLGSHAPGRSIAPGVEPYLAGHHMLLAHGRAAEIYRSMKPKDGKIAMVLNTEWAEAQEPDNPEDQAAVERALAFNLEWFASPLYEGDYPQIMGERVGSRLPKFTEAEMKMLKGSNDFFALNCYSARYICEDNFWRNLQNTPAKLRILPYISDVPLAKMKAAMAAQAAPVEAETVSKPTQGGPAMPSPENLPSTSWLADAGYETSIPLDAELTATGWPVAHYGLGRLLLYLQRRYAPTGGILVTEAGAAFEENGDAGVRQATYLKRQSVVLRRAMSEGVDVRGYIWWTLMDNFEWSYGYSKHFGLYAVDFANGSLSRTPRLAVSTFQHLATTNAVDPEVTNQDFSTCLERPDGLRREKV